MKTGGFMGEVLYLLGAGASADAGLPVGSGLLAELRKTIDLPAHLESLLNELAKRTDDVEAIAGFALLRSGIVSDRILPLYPPENLADASQEAFYDLYMALLRALPQLLATARARDFTYLEPLVKRAYLDASTIVTLNYDRLIEDAAAAIGLPAKADPTRHRPDVEDPWRSEELRILKLHGSLEWEYSAHRSRYGGKATWLPISNPILRKTAPDADGIPDVIFGAIEKLRAQGNFVAMYECFRRMLSKAQIVVIVGYGFADEHVNYALFEWMENPAPRSLHVVDKNLPDFIVKEDHPIHWTLQHWGIDAEHQHHVQFHRVSAKRFCTEFPDLA